MDQQPETNLKTATTEQRVINYIVDQLVIISIGVGMLFLLAMESSFEFRNIFTENRVAYFSLFVGYYIVFEALTGITPAKLITGTRAVNADGTPLTFGKAIGRSICRLIPLEQLSFLGGNGRPRGWHDRIPNTRVISVKDS